MDNVFITFASNYYKILSAMSNMNVRVTDEYTLARDYNVTHDPLLFAPSFKKYIAKINTKSNEIKKTLGWDRLNTELNFFRIKKIWNPNEASFADWLSLVKDYIEFIRYSEKCFMYKNESSIDREHSTVAVYCEDKNNTLYIRDFRRDVKIKIEFIESMVNDITIDATQSNSILDYVESGKTPKKQINVEFVHITISREWGKQLVNEFRFLSTETPKYHDPSDKELMDLIQNIVGDCLKITFYSIFDNNISKLAKRETTYLGDIVDGSAILVQKQQSILL